MTERRTFNGGMDSDTNPDMIREGDYIAGWNVRTQRDISGGGGALKPIESTVLAHDSGEAIKFAVGQIEDASRERVYWFKWQPNGDHAIMAWDRRAATAYTVFKKSNGNFLVEILPQTPVTSIAMVGDFLLWVDVNGRQFRIDVERGIKTNHPSYVYPDLSAPTPYALPMIEDDITLGRRAPIAVPQTTKITTEDDITVADVKTNYIERDWFTFAYRFVFRDGSYSVLSTWSRAVPHNRDGELYDAIKIELPKREFLENEIQKIEFCVKRRGAWSIIKTFDRDRDSAAFNNHNSPSSSGMSFYFFNETSGTPLSDEEASIPYFDIPITSRGLEVGKNRVFLSNNKRGYDYPDGMGIILSTKTTGATGTEIKGDYFKVLMGGALGPVELILLLIGPQYGNIAGWYSTTYTFSQFNSNSLPLTISPLPSTKYPIPYTSMPPDDLINYISPSHLGYTITSYTFARPTILGLGSFFGDVKVFRSGATIKVHVLFFDALGRNGGVMHDPESVSLIPTTYLQSDFTTEITYALQNDPSRIPLWARSYAVVRTAPEDYFVAAYSNNVRYGNLDPVDGTYDFTVTAFNDNQKIGIDLTGFITQQIGYVFADGDLVKLIRDDGAEYTLRITGIQGDFLVCDPQDIGLLTGETIYVEIYRPQNEEELYWEVGERFKVLQPGTPGRTLESPNGSLYGDYYVMNRPLGGVSRAVEAMSPNNKYWSDRPSDRGRANTLIYDPPKTFETELAFGGKYIPGTKVNNLGSFFAGDSEILDSKIGAIDKLVYTSRAAQYGSVLLAMGRTEIASIYIERTETYNAVEDGNLLTSTDVIGTVNILRGGHGLANPESVVEADGTVYWFSARSASFVRYDLNGAMNINGKMSALAKWIADKVNTGTNTRDPHLLWAGWDGFNSEYIVRIPKTMSGTFPVTYVTLDDLDEEVVSFTMNTQSSSVPIPLDAGQLYQLYADAHVPITISSFNDYFHGPILASSGFQFVATGAINISVNASTSAPVAIRVVKKTFSPYDHLSLMPRCMAFMDGDNYKGWKSYYRYVPELFSRIGTLMFSFRNGILYSHDGATAGNFYGADYEAGVAMPFNSPINGIKRLKSVAIESDVAPDYVHIRSEVPNIQSSDITDFLDFEGNHYAEVMRDRLTPGSVDYSSNLVSGDQIRGRYFKLFVKWAKNVKFALSIMNISHRTSAGHKTT